MRGSVFKCEGVCSNVSLLSGFLFCCSWGAAWPVLCWRCGVHAQVLAEQFTLSAFLA